MASTYPTEHTAQVIVNRCFDEANNRLRQNGDTGGLVNANPRKYSIQHIFNQIFDETNNEITL